MEYGIHGVPVRNVNKTMSSCSSHGGGLHHGFGTTKVGAWMPKTVDAQGVGHLSQGLLTLHDLMGDAGNNVKHRLIKKPNTKQES